MITRLLIVLYLSLISYAQTRHIVVLRDELTKQDVDELVSTIREADRDPSLPDVQCEVHDVLDTLSKMLIVTASKGAVDKVNNLMIVVLFKVTLYYYRLRRWRRCLTLKKIKS